MDQDRVKDWRELCKTAANELDPKKLMALIAEITRAQTSATKNRTLPLRTRERARRVFAALLLFEGECNDSDHWSKWKRRS